MPQNKKKDESKIRFTDLPLLLRISSDEGQTEKPAIMNCISLNGILIKCYNSTELKIGQHLGLIMKLDEEPMEVLGQVRAIKNNITIIQFCGIPVADLARIGKYMGLL